MRIGVNGFEAIIPRFGYGQNGLPNRVGSSEVCYELLVELARLDKKNNYVIYLPQKPAPDMPKEAENWRYEIIPSVKLWTIFGLTRRLLMQAKLDVFFSPTHYGPIYTPCPEVIAVLDVSYKYFPELFKKKDLYQLALWGKYSIKKSAKILTISNSSKRDIIKEYGVNERKVAVINLGVKEGAKSDMKAEELLKKYGVDKPYLLFVGTLQPRKNVKKLIEAYANLKKDNKDLSLVIIGRRGWMYDKIIRAPKDFGVEGDVKFLDSVTDEELPAFYENALIFVLPSLYEGFGLPILEAMKHGCPVATSNISSLPEAGGGAAIYFDPYDAADIAQKIKKVIENDKLRAEMIKKGHLQAKKFSWEKAARQVIDVFEEVGRRPQRASGSEGGQNAQ